VGSDSVILPSPALCRHSCLQERVEDLSVEKLVAHFPIEAFNITVLPGTSGLYEESLSPQTGKPGPFASKALFTDYTYDNLGIPKNPNNPFYTAPKKWNPLGKNWVDLGLGFTTGQESEYGLFKVPTLRNVDKRPYPEFVKAYGHNGYFKSLKEIVHFYNTRDVEAWPAPEVAMNIKTDELGNLGLTDAEEDTIVAFMKTLTDGYQP
jgi:cytochrome c peroxidase